MSLYPLVEPHRSLYKHTGARHRRDSDDSVGVSFFRFKRTCGRTRARVRAHVCLFFAARRICDDDDDGSKEMSISLRHQPLLSLPRDGCKETMSAVSIAIVGRSNEPLYVREFTADEAPSEKDLFGISLDGNASSDANDCSVRQQFILKEGMERLEHIDIPGFFWRASGATGNDANFVGCLFPIEDLRVYGK